MATQYGGSASRGFSSSQLRLGRTESLKEFAQVLQKQTTGRLRQTTEGIGRSAVSAALSPLPGAMQASMYSMLTSNPFGGGVSGDTESTVEKISDDVEDLKNPKWATNLMRLYREPLPVKIVKDRLSSLEAKRESMIDITPTAEKVEEDEKEEKKGFFGRLFDGFKKLFKFDGGLGKFLTTLMGGAGALALGALKFAKGVGLAGLLGTILFNDDILRQFTENFTEMAKDLGVTEVQARIIDFMSGGQKEGSFSQSMIGLMKGGATGALLGLMLAGPTGAVAGFLLGGVPLAIAGALGGEKLADITKFIDTWWDEGWSQAREKWAEKNVINLREDIKSTEQLLKQAEKQGDTAASFTLSAELYEKRKALQEQEEKLFMYKIQSAEDELKRMEERLNKLKTQDAVLNEIIDPSGGRARKMDEEMKETSTKFEASLKDVDLLSRDELLKKDYFEIENYFEKIIEEKESDRKYLIRDTRLRDRDQNFDNELQKINQTIKLLGDYESEMKQQKSMLNLRRSTASFNRPGMINYLQTLLYEDSQEGLQFRSRVADITGLGPGELSGESLAEYLKDPKQRIEFQNEMKKLRSEDDKLFDKIFNIQKKEIEQNESLLKKSEFLNRPLTEEELGETQSSLYSNPADSLIGPIDLITKSVENIVAMNTPSSMTPNMSNFGNVLNNVEGARTSNDVKVINHYFQTDSDRMNLAFVG